MSLSYESALAALRVAYHAGLAGTPALYPLGPWGDAAEALGLRDRMRSRPPRPLVPNANGSHGFGKRGHLNTPTGWATAARDGGA